MLYLQVYLAQVYLAQVYLAQVYPALTCLVWVCPALNQPTSSSILSKLARLLLPRFTPQWYRVVLDNLKAQG